MFTSNLLKIYSVTHHNFNNFIDKVQGTKKKSSICAITNIKFQTMTLVVASWYNKGGVLSQIHKNVDQIAL